MDCNKTINFLHELKRLCDSRDECVANAANKEDCPMFGICKLMRSKISAKDAEKAIEIVQNMWRQRPPKGARLEAGCSASNVKNVELPFRKNINLSFKSIPTVGFWWASTSAMRQKRTGTRGRMTSI